ncbi:unnamed protein product [Effrenium voratum]|nr:unnamed protein product [Effrenium voratum]|mmetsp:Transcript_6828/g.16149  ORF Transcript_6828/g.16149 Transcript_6828/m.16149 type:complete len:366 (-) Transcript_6828:55-1152(-)
MKYLLLALDSLALASAAAVHHPDVVQEPRGEDRKALFEVSAGGHVKPRRERSVMRSEAHAELAARAERDDSDMDHFQLRLLDDSQSKATTKRAIVTHICDSSWAPGALALAASLKKAGSQMNLVLMTTSDIDSRYQRLLSHVFDKVFVEEPVRPHESIVRDGADCVTLQLRAWQLPYEKLLYMDADMIALKNHDGLLDQFDELAARRDAGIHSQFNGGMFVLEPSQDKFQQLRNRLKDFRLPAKGNGGIQAFLNSAFPECPEASPGVGCWMGQLGDEYNKFTRELSEDQLASGTYASLHFSGDWGGQRKPWMADCMVSSDSVTRRKDTGLQSKILQVWLDAFRGVEAPEGLEDLLHIDCPAGDEM